MLIRIFLHVDVGVDLYIVNGTKTTQLVENSLLVFECNVTGLNLVTNIKFVGPNMCERQCPLPPKFQKRFQDGSLATRNNQTCRLSILPVTPAYSGIYYCEVEPLQHDTCHNFTSERINVTVTAVNSGPGPNIGTIVGAIVGSIIVSVIGLIGITVLVFFCRHRKMTQNTTGNISTHCH